MLGPGFAEKLTADLVEAGDTSLPKMRLRMFHLGSVRDSEEEIVPIGSGA